MISAKMKLANFLHLLLVYIIYPPPPSSSSSSSSEVLLIKRGFSTSPSQPPFHPILNEPSGVFSFGFLEVGSSQLDLAVIHLPSGQPVWRAIPASPASWDGSISLSFNGSLVLSDARKGVIWSTSTVDGDSLVLLNSSNLQIQKKLGEATSVLWQSFDFPSDTIVQGQNFTSKAALLSENQKFSMSLGFNYLALYMEFNGVAAAPMYWKRTALQAKAQIIQGKGPIYARVDPIGFLGMYQTEEVPVDVLSFDTFNRGIPGLRRLTLESDGNLKAYYWNGSAWVLDFQAIDNLCELPSTCGAYGLCQAEQPRCGCLDNSTSGCPLADSGNLCSVGGDEYTIFRSKGVELANKELANHLKVASLEECEQSCKQNCSCWGAVYNNVSGFCYSIDYPIQTLAEAGDEQKTGYFKVRTTRASSGGGLKNKAGIVLLLVAGVLVFLAAAGFGAYRVWKQRRRSSDASTVECPYKDLKSGSSFRSIELSESFRK
ncbi:hypothetical protein J5N97_021409 [Dioscorea zingiberensis]|uniref:Uncharacterized protein n=1 Tax=Dioscorea zingiberensis TaxID=325984 RepID=A0A9D5CJU3_9LILI|nr:hypothetical protein J5N97_021409 [Dioscorea zingiberensis]